MGVVVIPSVWVDTCVGGRGTSGTGGRTNECKLKSHFRSCTTETKYLRNSEQVRDVILLTFYNTKANKKPFDSSMTNTYGLIFSYTFPVNG